MFKYSLIELKWLMSKFGILSEVYDIRVFMSFREKYEIWTTWKFWRKSVQKGILVNLHPRGIFVILQERVIW